MPRMTKVDYDAYQARRAASSAKPQPIVRHEPVAEATGKGINPARIHVRITSFRRRLIDPDNLCPKYFIDCCRYCGWIPDDSAKEITLEVRQEKVGREYERTEITIEAL